VVAQIHNYLALAPKTSERESATQATV
jgi:hypothetical protein